MPCGCGTIPRFDGKHKSEQSTVCKSTFVSALRAEWNVCMGEDRIVRLSVEMCNYLREQQGFAHS